MTTVVVMGCTVEPDYSFPLPLASLLWRDVIGYPVRLFLVGTSDQWEHEAPECLAALRHHGLWHLFVPQIEGYSAVAVAKHVRQHAACLSDFGADEWIMPSDADLFPIRRDYFHQHEGRPERAVLYFSNGDEFKSADAAVTGIAEHRRFPTLPMCHTTMRAREWRDVWQFHADDLIGSMRHTFERCGVGAPIPAPIDETPDGWAWWLDSDQRVSTALLSAQAWFSPRGVRMLWRSKVGGPPDDRLDRANLSKWPQVVSAAGLADQWVDAHIPRAPHLEENWALLRPIVEALMPQHAAWVRGYQRRWLPVPQRQLKPAAPIQQEIRPVVRLDAPAPTPADEIHDLIAS